MSRQIALVVEAIENFQLDSSKEYYVRVTMGSLKVGTHLVAPERSVLLYNTHTNMPSEAADDPNLSVELIDSYDEVVGQRHIRDWAQRLQGQDKAALTVSLYSPDDLRGASSTGKEDSLTAVGTAKIRIYLKPSYKEWQAKYNRLDVYVSKISDIIIDELIDSPPHILLRLGPSKGVSVSGTPMRGADEGEWVWEEVLPFYYSGEDEVYFSVRDGRTDEEVGKAVLFVPQLAISVAKEKCAALQESEISGKPPMAVPTKKAGYIPINDQMGATIGMILVGAELWDSNSVHGSRGSSIDIMKSLEERIVFDENLLKVLDKQRDGIPAVAQADRILVETELADSKNCLQEALLMEADSGAGLKSRRDIKKDRQRQIVKADEIENHLAKAEQRLYHMSCDRAKDFNAWLLRLNETAESLMRRCQIEASTSPRRSNESSPAVQLEKYSQEMAELRLQSKKLKREVYHSEKMNTIPESLKKMVGLLNDVDDVIRGLLMASSKMRERNEALREEERLRQLKLQEKMFAVPPPVIVERTGLNCFSCCMGENVDSKYEFMGDEIPEYQA